MVSHSPLPIAGIILAGGSSKRMGQDKALLDWGGTSLLDRARKLLKDMQCEQTWVMGKPGETDGLPDTDIGAGPGLALLDALHHAQTHGLKGVLAIPVDMPKLTSDILNPLIDPVHRQACAWHYHPLPVFLPVSLWQASRNDIQSIKDLLAAGPHHRPKLPEALIPLMDNINTPQDFEGLL